MGFLEFLGGRHNPGPMGDVEMGHPDPGGPWLGARYLLTAALLVGWAFLLLQMTSSAEALAAAIVLSLVYLGAAFFFHPEPDYSNIGFSS